jgi:allantoin racemase
MHVRVINPVITTRWEQDTQQEYSAAARAGTRVTTLSIDWGPASIENRFDEAIATPAILARVMEAQDEGVDAVIIDCMGDPGLFAAREVVDIPVVGPAEASMYLAALLGHRFSVISLLEMDVPVTIELAARYGLADRLASVRPILVPVLDIHSSFDATLKAAIEKSAAAVQEDGACVILPGCGLLANMASHIASGLEERGCPAPVLNPRAVAIKLAESLADLGQSHSRRTFVRPDVKEIRWPVASRFCQ